MSRSMSELADAMEAIGRAQQTEWYLPDVDAGEQAELLCEALELLGNQASMQGTKDAVKRLLAAYSGEGK